MRLTVLWTATLVLAAFVAPLDTAAAVVAKERDTVVFVCEHGSVKSLMAATLFEQAAKRRGLAVQGISRGLKPAERVPQRIVEALKADGIDVASFQPQHVTRAEVSGALRVVTIGIDSSSLGTEGTVSEAWNDVPESADYPAARAAVERRVQELLDQLQPESLDAVLGRIRDAALASDWPYRRLVDLTDKIGPRLSGSVQAQAAVEQVAAAMRSVGLDVQLMPVKAPHWVRGIETAELADYPGRPAGITQKLHVTALGSSVATAPDGMRAQVLVVKSFDDLARRTAQAKDKVVLFDVPFDRDLAENGHSARAYELSAAYRRQGPAAAARAGAAAALVRSVGGASYRLPHTGQTRYEGTRIPAAAISAEDSALIARLAAEGVVTVRLTLTPQTLPDVDSANVVADLVGREKPEEIVIVSGHLDSWDLGTGAIDDGAGVAAAMGVAHVLRELGLRPKRTIRVVAWMSEENGGAGAAAYLAANRENLTRHAAAIESDNGAGRPLGFAARITAQSVKKLQPVRDALLPIGATVIDRVDEPRGTDIADLQHAGIPGFEPLLDARHYFDYHHTAADTLDKVDPANLQRLVASMAVLTYFLAERDEMLERTEVVHR